MADNSKRVEAGFDSGQVIALRMPEKELTSLRKALGKGDGWHQVATEDDTVDLDLDKLVFLRTAGDGKSVGF